MTKFTCAIAALIGLAGVSAGFAQRPATALAPTSTPATAASAAASAAEANNADRDFEAFNNFRKTEPPAAPAEMGTANYLLWYDQMLLKTNLAGMAYINRYPNEPRRWDVAVALLNAPPLFIKNIGPDIDQKGAGAIVADEHAKGIWERKAKSLREALMASSDATIEVREAADWGIFSRSLHIAIQSVEAGQTANWQSFHAQFDRHAATYSELDIVASRAEEYLGAMEKAVPGSAAAEWKHLLRAPNRELRLHAVSRARAIEAMSHTFDLQFTALDGRPVDLTKYKGKIVILDFWSKNVGSWLNDLPALKALYRVYHSRGLEIVGVAVAREGERQAFKDFIAENKIAWPQYFDGHGELTDPAVLYGVRRIPWRFLVDRNGHAISTSTKIEDLAAQVKTLLPDAPGGN